MEFNKLYTVEDIAMITGLTTRTIRTYLKSGRLKGKKVGGQWRFTEEDINSLFLDKEVSDKISNNNSKVVNDFLTNETSENLICSVLDYNFSTENEAKVLADDICQFINKYNGDSKLHFSYQYIKEWKKARFIVTGDIDIIGKVIDYLRNKK